MILRLQKTIDEEQICQLLLDAHGSQKHVDLYQNLKQSGAPLIGIVAEVDKVVCGFIMFSPITLNRKLVRWYALSALAVQTSHQSNGIGRALIERGIQTCAELGIEAIVALNRNLDKLASGFVLAADFDIASNLANTNRPLMIKPLKDSKPASGQVHFHPVIEQLGVELDELI